jgi:hypothetical protein
MAIVTLSPLRSDAVERLREHLSERVIDACGWSKSERPP